MDVKHHARRRQYCAHALMVLVAMVEVAVVVVVVVVCPAGFYPSRVSDSSVTAWAVVIGCVELGQEPSLPPSPPPPPFHGDGLVTPGVQWGSPWWHRLVLLTVAMPLSTRHDCVSAAAPIPSPFPLPLPLPPLPLPPPPLRPYSVLPSQSQFSLAECWRWDHDGILLLLRLLLLLLPYKFVPVPKARS